MNDYADYPHFPGGTDVFGAMGMVPFASKIEVAQQRRRLRFPVPLGLGQEGYHIVCFCIHLASPKLLTVNTEAALGSINGTDVNCAVSVTLPTSKQYQQREDRGP